MKRRSTVAVAALVALALVGAGVWRAQRPAAATPAAAPPAAGVGSVGAVPVPAVTSTAAARVPVTAPRDSLRGTDVDGAIRLDANGDPIADRELRRVFDYFLERLGERSPDAIRAGLVTWLAHASGLSARAQARVLQLFDAYVDAECAAATLAASGDLRDDFERRRALRRDRLGEAIADAWFGSDERYADYTLRRLALERDASIGMDEREARREVLERELDPAQGEALRTSTEFQHAIAQTARLDALDAGAVQRYAERAAEWGDDAAGRLAQLDAQRAQWRQRVHDYASERAAIEDDASLSTSARAARIEALLASRFDEAERRRVLALAEVGLR